MRYKHWSVYILLFVMHVYVLSTHYVHTVKYTYYTYPTYISCKWDLDFSEIVVICYFN